MKLKIVSSGSIGNCYVFENDVEILIIECGVGIETIKKAINYDLKKVVGCLATHYHNDHTKSINKVMDLGINVFALKETFKHYNCKSYNQKEIIPLKSFTIGNFKILPFPVKHDVPCVGFMINHPDTGNFLFITDTYFVEYTFPNLNNIIVEANFCHDIINKNFGSESKNEFLRNRILKSHFSLKDCKDMLQANDLSKVNNIVLIHLSNGNSDAKRFQKEVNELTGKRTTIAENGIEIDFFKDPF